MDNKFVIMQKAIDAAAEAVSTGEGFPFGGVIVKNGQIIMVAHNESIKNNDPTAHGEVTTIRKACSKLETMDLKGYELYASCHPCSMCLGASAWSGLDKVYYAATVEESNRYIDYKDLFGFAKVVKPELLPLEHIQMPNDEQLVPFELYKKKCSK